MNRKQRRAAGSKKSAARTAPGTGSNAAAEFERAIAAYRAGDHATAAQICRALIKAGSNDSACHHLLGVAAGNLGHNDEAATAIARACELTPDNAELRVNLGLIEAARGNEAAAESAYRAAIAIDPQSAAAHNNLGALLMRIGRPDAAVEPLRAAVSVKPDFALANANLAAVLIKLGRYDEAIPLLREAARLQPDLAKAQCNLGFALRRKGYIDEAVAAFRAALAREPDYPEAMTGLAVCMALRNETEEATALLKRALELKPDYPEAAGQYLHELRLVCDWEEAARWKSVVDRANEAALAAGERPPETPFGHLIGNRDPATNLRIARAAAGELERLMAAQAPRFEHASGGDPGKRLRIGYLSSDLRGHAVGQVARQLFGLHDRAGFEIHCYSTGRNDGGEIRRAIEAGADRFTDIMAEDFVTAARRIRDDGIDILVDLNGWTAGNRLEIMALKPAPILATWLGYPGTTGASFVDYLIADPVIATPDDQAHFAERLCLLPDCYMVTDNQQPIAEEAVTRAEFGLPDEGTVFCSFNNGYKIEPGVFGAWMEILRAVEGAVIWLPALSRTIQHNLHRAATAAGIAPTRLVFATRVDKKLHLKRTGLADLGLDTLIFNGHSTTADTLWGGVPVVTVRGGHFASRVSASLLTAVGLDDCIRRDRDDYVRAAIELARDPAALHALKMRLARNRIERPLFQTTRFVRNLERGYRAMWRLHAAGDAPATIEVAGD